MLWVLSAWTSESLPSENLAVHVLDRCTLGWIKSCLEGQAQRMVGNGARSNWPVVSGGVPPACVGPNPI